MALAPNGIAEWPRTGRRGGVPKRWHVRLGRRGRQDGASLLRARLGSPQTGGIVVLAWVQRGDQLLEAGFERGEPLIDFLSLG
jgi:hypothetical protein